MKKIYLSLIVLFGVSCLVAAQTVEQTTQPVEQTQPVVPPEPEQPPNLPEPKVELTPESIVVEQQETAPPSSGETDVQMQEPKSAEVSVPTNGDVTRAPEVAPKKKSFGQRLRKSVMGY